MKVCRDKVLPLKYAPNANLKKNARLAKQFTVQWLRDHEEKGVTLSRVLRGKYFRYIATVTSDGENLGQQLIDNGHAVSHYGGTRIDWCK